MAVALASGLVINVDFYSATRDELREFVSKVILGDFTIEFGVESTNVVKGVDL